MTSRKIHGAKIQIHIAACNWRDGRSQSDRSNAADRQPFLPRATLPVEIPYHEFTAAEKLVNDCGNHRRNQDLSDTKDAIISQQPA